jgi:tetratricopeptide (TPR) repeat protein
MIRCKPFLFGASARKSELVKGAIVMTAEFCLENGIQQALQGNSAEAVAWFRRAIELQPDYPQGFNNLGLMLKDMRQFGEAEACLCRAVAIKPDYPEALYNLGILMDETQRPLEAIQYFCRAAENKTDYADAYFALGVMYTQTQCVTEAIRSFSRVLEINPTHREAYLQLGLLLAAGKNRFEAEKCLKRAVERIPGFAEAYLNLGFLQVNEKRWEEAAGSFRCAIAANPDFAEAYNNLGMVMKYKNCLVEAEECLRNAIAIRVNFAEAYINLGLVLTAAKRLEEAEDCFRKNIVLRPEQAEGHMQLGRLLQEQGRIAEAEASFRRASGAPSGSAEGLNALGVFLKDVNRREEAVACLRQALTLRPNYPEVYNNLGLLLKDSCNPEQALECFRQAIRLRPDYPEAYNNFGVVLAEEQMTEAAEAAFHKAIELDENYPEAYSNLGLFLLKNTERMVEAQTHLLRAVALRPDFPSADFALGILYLLQEKYDVGWEKYEMRFRVFNYIHPSFPQWRGEELTGKRILLYHEQGLGDTIQFFRYAFQVAALAAETVVLVQKPLEKLLSEAAEGFLVCSPEHLPEQQFDFACPLLSLPLVFNTVTGTIPQHIPYLHAEKASGIAWSKALYGVTGSKARLVGIAWAGNPDHHNDRNRSIPFSLFSNLFNEEECRFISLQVGERANDLLQTAVPVTDYARELVDFAETAGLIANLDLVITIDSAVAHLAGAMGKETWLLLPYIPDWRWLLTREDTPWYPTLRLFRQRKSGDWAEVLQRVKLALREKKKQR